ncbi:DUF6691 family protein [Sphingomonas oligophenolica]|uniref:YeeE/YedE family protein n=1 Tax=Sphingomonas oligophenolica TaxID=301154 RepID=A0A502C3I0_9SPHN|nr:DUF6691 family protein [Sphingomonas oligophenolica]TPG06579.1 YeeE/YedE family protein [Sphingomonas oligophenolica]
MVARSATVALLSGLIFGAGLAVSGMTDPARVRAFLDVAGDWDPTLAFVMVGAILPMIVAWRIKARLDRPLVGNGFHLPATSTIDRRLVGGAVLFGVGWGIAGLCPGPGIADLAVRPLPAAAFVVAMLGGMLVNRLNCSRTPELKEPKHAVQQA